MKRLLFALFVSLVSTSAMAGVYLEPYVGYASGNYDSKMVVTTPIAGTLESDGKEKGMTFGAKAGLAAGPLVVGVDYMHADLDFDNDTEEGKIKADDLGAFISFPLFWGLRFNGSYFFSSKAKSEGDEYSGTGSKLGLGFRLFYFIHLNFDVISHEYDDGKFAGIEFSSLSIKDDTKMISISFPVGGM